MTASDVFEVKVKRVATARSLKLRVYPDGTVVVTAPKFAPVFMINKFVDEHREWVLQKRTKAVDHLESLTTERESLLLRGTSLGLRLRISTDKPGTKIENDKLLVTAPSEDHATVRSILEKWYRFEAKKHFTARVPLLSDLVDRDLKNVTIRSQRSRWGSCSSRNTISLNWRLIMAPDWVSDYVIYHELAHLTHMNHSNKFWQLVEQYHPRHKEAEVWLKDHRSLLQF